MARRGGLKLNEKQREAIIEYISKYFDTTEDYARRVETLLENYPAHVIMRAVRTVGRVDKHCKSKKIPFEKLEESLKKMRW